MSFYGFYFMFLVFYLKSKIPTAYSRGPPRENLQHVSRPVHGSDTLDIAIASEINSDPALLWTATPRPYLANLKLSEIRQRFNGGQSELTLSDKKDSFKDSFMELEPSHIVKQTLPDNFYLPEQYPQCTTLLQIDDQKKCGGCWAWGIVALLRDSLCIHLGMNEQQISIQQLLSCASFGWKSIESQGCGGIYSLKTVLLDVEDFGLVSGDAVPTTSSQYCYPVETAALNKQPTVCRRSCKNREDFLADRYGMGLTGYQDIKADQIEEIQRVIMSSGSVLMEIKAYEDFLHYRFGSDDIYQHRTGRMLGGHYLKVIGWGKTLQQILYWKCVNTWGGTHALVNIAADRLQHRSQVIVSVHTFIAAEETSLPNRLEFEHYCHLYAREGLEEEFNALFAEHSEKCFRGPFGASGRSILHNAIIGGSKRIIEILIEDKRSSELWQMKDVLGHYPSHYLYSLGSPDIFSLLSHRKELNKHSSLRLHVSISHDNRKLIKPLLESATDHNDLEMLDSEGKSALMKAAEVLSLESVKLILSHAKRLGYDINQRGTLSNFPTALHIAANFGNIDIVNQLLQGGADFRIPCLTYGRNAGHLASRQGHDIVLERLLEAGLEIDSTDRKGDTFLHIASAYGRTTVVSLLLGRKGIDIEAKNSLGRTPLYLASIKGSAAVSALLLEKKADVMTRSQKSVSLAAHMAAKKGFNRIVENFLNHNFPVDTQNKKGNTLLHIAAETGNALLVGKILHFQPKLIVFNNRRETSVLIALRKKNNEITDLLRKYMLNREIPEVLMAPSVRTCPGALLCPGHVARIAHVIKRMCSETVCLSELSIKASQQRDCDLSEKLCFPSLALATGTEQKSQCFGPSLCSLREPNNRNELALCSGPATCISGNNRFGCTISARQCDGLSSQLCPGAISRLCSDMNTGKCYGPLLCIDTPQYTSKMSRCTGPLVSFSEFGKNQHRRGRLCEARVSTCATPVARICPSTFIDFGECSGEIICPDKLNGTSRISLRPKL